MKTVPKSIAWRIYAVVIGYVLCIQHILSQIAHPAIAGWLVTPLNFLAAFGVGTWAFGWRFGPNVFWKIVAALFAAALLIDLYPSVASFFRGESNHWSWEWTVAVLIAVPIYAPVCVALTRAGRRGTAKPTPDTASKTGDGGTARLARLKARTSL